LNISSDSGTGRSPSGVHSVTVLAADGLSSEALSKAVFVMGVARGLALINGLSGVDAVVVDAQGALHASAGLLQGQPTPAASTDAPCSDLQPLDSQPGELQTCTQALPACQ